MPFTLTPPPLSLSPFSLFFALLFYIVNPRLSLRRPLAPSHLTHSTQMVIWFLARNSCLGSVKNIWAREEMEEPREDRGESLCPTQGKASGRCTRSICFTLTP